MNLLNDKNLTIAKIAPLLRQREISPVELTEYFLGRIDRLQPRLNAFITLTKNLARNQARQMEKEILKGHYRGALHGIPITLKDLFYTAGVRTTGGSKILRNFIPKENAIVVDRLFAAGSILLGKTNLHEFAYGVTNANPHYGPTHNPWNLSRVTGGSSGGSAAAVSAGLCLGSLGTDTGGSIRIPSGAFADFPLRNSFSFLPFPPLRRGKEGTNCDLLYVMNGHFPLTFGGWAKRVRMAEVRKAKAAIRKASR
jgi:aspartyl-tRNA(Asn)/glutamyl-tRNA(Gln) amidotransferase subunit A